ncbi:MAG: IclR family transcriptional regulator [Candidatus Binatia bacterium]|nr:IclR family transcriptional regulator [Candidatus Binatia bacterium]
MRRDKTNYVIQSVSHALDVLEQFAGNQEELGVTELSKRLKLHKNNVFRILATLEARGYIEQNKLTENYRLGVRCLSLGQRYLSQVGLLKPARPVLQQLAQASGETAVIGVVRLGMAVVLDAAHAEQPVRVVARMGEPIPLHCSAIGKVALAFGETSLREGLTEPLKPCTEKTVVDKERLFAELDRVAAQGFATEEGEHVADVTAAATPVRDYTGCFVAALALLGPVHRMTEQRLREQIVPLLARASEELSARLGFEPKK